MSCMSRWLVAAALVVSTSYPASAIDISTCGEMIPRGQTGRLVADLACSGGYAVVLEQSATVDLNGHSITTSNGGSGVSCLGRRCSVVSAVATPGDMSDADGGINATFGIVASDLRRLTVANVSITSFTFGIRVPDARVSLTDVTVSDCPNVGILATKLRLANVTANNNKHGMGASRSVSGSNVTAIGNQEFGIDSTGGRVKIDGVLSTGNGRFGVFARIVKLANGTVTGNGEVDIVALRRPPRLINITCDSSASGPLPSPSWGVCSLDP